MRSRVFYILLFLFIIFVAVLLVTSTPGSLGTVADSQIINKFSDNIVEENSPEPVGRLLMVGHFADTPLASTTALIKDLQVGGIIIMSAPKNPEDIVLWTTEWQEASEKPLLIAIDQEGGVVSRLKSPGFIQTGQREISTTDQSYTVGLKRGQELSALGINMNFAPVLDTAVNPNSFMYNRTFPDSSPAAKLASGMYQGMQDAGVTAVAKHFPGHDDTTVDSHEELPVVTIKKSELPTFAKNFTEFILETKPKALMTAHVQFPDIDPLPATLSHYFLTSYLRQTLGFTGMIITDDMSMDAIDKNWDTNRATLMSLQAGADMVLFAAEPEKARAAVSTLNEALLNGDISQKEIKSKVVRQEGARN